MIRRVWLDASKTAPKKPEWVAARTDPWHAVSIETHPASCAAARALQKARFLSAQAPGLPLTHCPIKESCPCLYKHHADRRAHSRRREEITGLRRNVPVVEERRLVRDRRQIDPW